LICSCCSFVLIAQSDLSSFVDILNCSTLLCDYRGYLFQSLVAATGDAQSPFVVLTRYILHAKTDPVIRNLHCVLLPNASVQELYQAGEARWGTEESKFNQILCTQSHTQLRATFDEYQRIAHRSIVQSLTRELSGDLLMGMLTVGRGFAAFMV